ncbi:MAG TPA: substrate-binding domain-containing protein [Coriobacteriia bacterium]
MRARVALPAVLACVAVAATLVTGCGGSSAVTGPAAEVTRLRVSGSGTCLPLLRILASGQPDEQVRLIFLPGLHSKGGIKGVMQGTLDIGAVSRDLTREERSPDFKVTWLSNDGIVVAVNQSVGRLGIAGITQQQVRDIYTGKITDWEQLGATKKLPIVVLDRHEDESAKIIMRKYVFGGPDKLKVTKDSVNLYYESDMVDALRTTTGAIGYFSLGYAISQNVPVTLLKLDGVDPSVENVASGAYKVVRPLGIVTKADAPKAVQSFVTWATGPEARQIMIKKGYVPYSE